MKEIPAGLILICNDLGEVEQVPLDGLGLMAAVKPSHNKPVFLRLVERESLEQARAFLTDLRINRKVSDRELTIQTSEGPLNIIFAGLKTSSQFVIVAAKTADLREKLLAQALSQIQPTAEPPAERKPSMATQQLKSRLEVVKAEATETQPTPKAFSPTEKPHSNLRATRAELERTHRDLYALALIDTLTGIYNRRHFIERLKEELREAERYKRSPAFLLLDIDKFKAINEQHGLQAGDVILRSTAEIIRGVLRKVDLVGRLGGDEFGILLLETTPENSLRAARRLQKKLSDVGIEAEGRIFKIAVSIAVIHLSEAKSFSADHLLKQAEDLLKQAKSAGENQIIHA